MNQVMVQPRKSDIELVVEYSRIIEKKLAVVYGAQGKSLGAKLRSIKRVISADLNEKCWKINKVRNTVIHNEDGKINNRMLFIKTAEQVINELNRLKNQQKREQEAQLQAQLQAKKNFVDSFFDYFKNKFR